MLQTTLPSLMFALPADPRPSAWNEHIPFAFWLIDRLKPQCLVELGTYHGASFLAFCQAIAATGAPTRAFAVDTWQGDAHAGSIAPDIHGGLKAVVDAKYAGFATLLRMDFDSALKTFADNSVDLLHIDGLHTYEAVRHDFESWRPKLTENAVVLFHDTQVFTSDFGVNRFWNEVRGLGRSFEFMHGFGLGVLAFGTAGARLSELLDASDADVDYMRTVFGRLGRGVSDMQHLQQADAEVARLLRSNEYRLGRRIRRLFALRA